MCSSSAKNNNLTAKQSDTFGVSKSNLWSSNFKGEIQEINVMRPLKVYEVVGVNVLRGGAYGYLGFSLFDLGTKLFAQ